MFKYSLEGPQKELLDYIVRMAYISEIKEWDNRSHIERLRRYFQVIGTGLDISQQEMMIISTASQLHDVGKINIPEEITKKTEQYTDAEWEVIERHTIHGQNILAGSSSLVLQVAEIIALTHHERWDGSGYPQGLKGEEIPLSGRICALADVFDGLTTERPYKKTVDETEGLRIIKDARGVLFDPRIVDVFEENFSEILKLKRSVK